MSVIQALAQSLLEYLRPGCERIEIAGSIRRGKTNPKDIELLAIPLVVTEMATVDMFGNAGTPIEHNRLDYYLERMYTNGLGTWTLDPVLKRNGAKYKRLRYWGELEVCCDLFITDKDQWGAQMVIRTGPADFSHMLVTRALHMGMKQEDGRLWRTHRDDTKTVIETPTEESYFKALGMDYIEPEMRGKVPA